MKEDLWRKHKKKCTLCGRFMKLKDVTVDHIIPKSKGGANDILNYQPAHRLCNLIKGNTMPKEFKGILKASMITLLRHRKLQVYTEKAINTAWERGQKDMLEMFRKAKEIINK